MSAGGGVAEDRSSPAGQRCFSPGGRRPGDKQARSSGQGVTWPEQHQRTGNGSWTREESGGEAETEKERKGCGGVGAAWSPPCRGPGE